MKRDRYLVTVTASLSLPCHFQPKGFLVVLVEIISREDSVANDIDLVASFEDGEKTSLTLTDRRGASCFPQNVQLLYFSYTVTTRRFVIIARRRLCRFVLYVRIIIKKLSHAALVIVPRLDEEANGCVNVIKTLSLMSSRRICAGDIYRRYCHANGECNIS